MHIIAWINVSANNLKLQTNNNTGINIKLFQLFVPSNQLTIICLSEVSFIIFKS